MKNKYHKLEKYISEIREYLNLRKPIAFRINKLKDEFGTCEYIDIYNVWYIEISDKAFQNDIALFLTIFHEMMHIILWGFDDEFAHKIIYKLEDIILDNSLPKAKVIKNYRKNLKVFDNSIVRKIGYILARMGDEKYLEHASEINKLFKEL